MSRTGKVTLPWGDGEYEFRLAYKQLLLLQEECDAGPAFMANRLREQDADWRVKDIRETIRLGLMGAGMSQADALTKITRFVDSVPLEENRLVAWVILKTAIVGAPDEPILGKAPRKRNKASRFQEEKSPSVASSASPAPSASALTSSTA